MRRREAADRHRRRQGRVGAEEAAARQAPLLVLPPEPASRHLSACLSPTAGSRPPLQTRSVGAGRLLASPADPQRWRRQPARAPHGIGGAGERPWRPSAAAAAAGSHAPPRRRRAAAASGPRAPRPAPAPQIFRWASCLDKRELMRTRGGERECKR